MHKPELRSQPHLWKGTLERTRSSAWLRKGAKKFAMHLSEYWAGYFLHTYNTVSMENLPAFWVSLSFPLVDAVQITVNLTEHCDMSGG